MVKQMRQIIAVIVFAAPDLRTMARRQSISENMSIPLTDPVPSMLPLPAAEY